MNGRTAFNIFLGFILLPASTARSATVSLSLEEAFSRAPEANFQILLSQEALTSAEQSSRAAFSGLLPQVSLSASQSRAMSPNVDPLSASFPGIPERFYANRFDALVRARMALFNTRTRADYKISRLSLEATRQQVDNAIQQILQQIALSYFGHWRNERRLDVIDANLERDRLLLRIAEDQQEAGVATALDVTRAEVRLASNELARLQQETQVLNSALQLKRVLNIPLSNELVIEAGPMAVDKTGSAFDEQRFEQVLARRPDFRQIQLQVEREELALKASKRDRWPSLDLSGEWGVAAQNWDDDLKEQWAVQLGVSMPVFEGFRLDAEKQLAASDLRQRRLELDDLAARIEADYRLVLQDLQSRARQVEVAKRSVELNQREFELARIRFEEGVADNSDVVTAQAALADAEDTLVEAEFQYVQARVNMARIEGDVRAVLDY